MTATAVLRECAAHILKENIRIEVSDPRGDATWVCRVKEGNIEHCAYLIADAISAALAEPAIEEGWQPIETAPKDTECFFWLDWADDCVALNPPIDTMAQLFRGKQRQWASVYKATHWRPLFSPPDEHAASLSREVVGVESKKDQFRRWR